MISVTRKHTNPILRPGSISADTRAAFHLSSITVGKEKAFIYRGEGRPLRIGGREFIESRVCVALTHKGKTSHRVLVSPSEEWDRFGCEDPRVVKVTGGRYAIFYTALSTFPFTAEGIKVGVAFTKDFKTIDSKHLVTPFNAKAMTLFPEKVKGKIAGFVTVNPDKPPARILYFEADSIEEMLSENFWNSRYEQLSSQPSLSLVRKESDHIEIGARPLKTAKGWLLIYSHIQNYFDEHGRIFGIEAALLSLTNPQEIIGRTAYPLLVPEARYEQEGNVRGIVFPSGVSLHEDTLTIYYSGADTVGCAATCSLSRLLVLVTGASKKDIVRTPHNPILQPNKKHDFESQAVFNPASIQTIGRLHLLYRAMSLDNTSYIGHAVSRDGIRFVKDEFPVYTPQEAAEEKRIPHGNSGAEDPRVTAINGRWYVCYTAYNGTEAPRVALISVKESDALKGVWRWSKSFCITPAGADDKDACIFPEKIGKAFYLIHRVNHRICFDAIPSDTLDSPFIVETATPIISPRKGMWDSEKVGLAGRPLKTKYGWLLFYHGIGMDKGYRLGCALLDLKDPTRILARTDAPLLEPELSFEKQGQVGNVVFPTGFELLNHTTLYIYYGAADSVTCLATMKLAKLLEILGVQK